MGLPKIWPAWQDQKATRELRTVPDTRDRVGLLVRAIDFNRLGGSVNRRDLIYC